MAQTGYTPIQLYYSTTASAVPAAGNLLSGELAINIADRKLFAKDSGGTVFTLSDPTNTVLTTNSYTDPSWLTITSTKVGLGNVENTALSTWSGSTNITTIGAATATSLSVTGNLTVSGTTTTINSTTLTLQDPIITLGGSTAPTVDDNKDRGIEFRWHNGTTSKVGFFGFDDSTGYFTFIPDATNTSEVFSGTTGILDVVGITGNAATVTNGVYTNSSVISANLVDAVGYKGAPLNEQSTAYTLVLGDMGKSVVHPATDNNPRTFTIPANSATAFPVGTVVTFINMINTVTIAIDTDTLYLAGTGVTGSRTLGAYGMATAIKMTSTTWIISGNGLT